jgi:glutamate-1-semialdehyde 2,1-aminomutase
VAGGAYARFFSAMLERGVALAPGPYEAMFPGLAHLEVHLDAVVEAAGEAAAGIKANRSFVG